MVGMGTADLALCDESPKEAVEKTPDETGAGRVVVIVVSFPCLLG